MVLHSVGILSFVNMGQQINGNLCFKLGKSATGTYEILRKLYGDKFVSQCRVFKWLKRFKEGREVIEGELHAGRPRTSKTDGNIEKVDDILRSH